MDSAFSSSRAYSASVPGEALEYLNQGQCSDWLEAFKFLIYGQCSDWLKAFKWI